jgi:hypothetical protein
MPSDAHNELQWLAFRYVAGELSGDEAAQFEDRLDQDQQAREAVAAAVELTEAVVASGADRPRVLPMRRRFRATAMWTFASAAAAACIAVVVWHGDSGRPASTARESAQDVALTWSGLHQTGEDAANLPTDLLASIDDSIRQSDLDVAVAAGGLDAGDAALPPWLVEAAALRDGPRNAGPEIEEN